MGEREIGEGGVTTVRVGILRLMGVSRVLVVEDEPSIADSVVYALENRSEGGAMASLEIVLQDLLKLEFTSFSSCVHDRFTEICDDGEWILMRPLPRV